ncbi:MAG: 3-deoxy-8-phosphooctulonate synthase [Lactobacillaceae bacterium]|jgi:2-dehydro-3-deoxyphosphooctonate aldolase (KDO 8-P synthase)|nr:3-deoxy-8-phosphooctulonate synthase [Lactobacillaceae bacterium]
MAQPIKRIKVGGFEIGNDLPFTLVAGQCQMQDRDLSLKTAEHLVKICEKLKINFIFKNSYDKANRNSVTGARGVGLEYALPVFEEIKKTFGCPIMTDVHNEEQAAIVAPYVDIIQQPAFLIRQTDLSVAIAKTGKVCSLKKMQMMAAGDMKNVIGKYEANGNKNLILTDRGVSFGYGDLIVDIRNYVEMAETGYPIMCDATHSVQKPGGMGTSSGGDAFLAPIITRAALSTGLLGAVYVETHSEPLKGGSDIHNMVPLMYMKELLAQWKAIDEAAKANPSRRQDDWNQTGQPI